MSAIAGVMLVDYYIIKKQKLNLHDMYKTHGIYFYTKGFNCQAFAAFFLAVIPLMPGFAKSIDHSINVGGAWKVYTFAWLFGFTTSSLSYYVICTYIKGLGEAVVDVAIYPAQLGEGADEEAGMAVTISSDDSVKEKNMSVAIDVVTTEKSKA